MKSDLGSTVKLAGLKTPFFSTRPFTFSFVAGGDPQHSFSVGATEDGAPKHCLGRPNGPSDAFFSLTGKQTPKKRKHAWRRRLPFQYGSVLKWDNKGKEKERCKTGPE